MRPYGVCKFRYEIVNPIFGKYKSKLMNEFESGNYKKLYSGVKWGGN